MLKKITKRVSYIAVSSIFIFLLAVPCLAATNEVVRMTNIKSARCDLLFENGNVIASASVTGVSGAEKCKIALKLQEKQGSRWATIDTCTVENDLFVVSTNISAKSEQGVTYRAQATVTVWVDGTSETKTVTTQEGKA